MIAFVEDELIPEYICNKLCLSYDALMSPSRKRDLVLARVIISFELRERGLTLSSIGRLINRDHSDICHLLKLRDGLVKNKLFKLLEYVIYK